ncbi:MAG: TIGR00341 family protein, partial [Gemmatimonadota bacterium]
KWLTQFGRRFALPAGTDGAGTQARVSSQAALTPENLWLLVCSAVLASIGLDLDSVAVIIGAMLISPLMGPILGVGLGLGTTDRSLLQRSLRELAFATFFTLGASALYFLVSPLATVNGELLSRTRPTLLDVGVAFFGGVAGIVAGSRKDLSLALPGVAIATALMPPLCTAGFGLATGNWAFFFGAFYLYSLNAVFIALSTFLIVRFLRFPRHEQLSAEAHRQERQLVAFVALLATLPSVYFLYDAVRHLRERKRIAEFVETRVDGPGRSVAQWEEQPGKDGIVLKVYVAGKPIEPAAAESLQAALPGVGLKGLRLELVQSDISADDLTRFQGDVQRDILRAISTAMSSRDSATQQRVRAEGDRFEAAAREVASAFPEIVGLSYAPRQNLLTPDSVTSPPAILLAFAPGTRTATRREIVSRVTPLLRTRLKLATLAIEER